MYPGQSTTQVVCAPSGWVVLQEVVLYFRETFGVEFR